MGSVGGGAAHGCGPRAALVALAVRDTSEGHKPAGFKEKTRHRKEEKETNGCLRYNVSVVLLLQSRV